MIEYQDDRSRRCGGVGDGVTLINPRWAPEQSLTVTTLSSAVEGVLVLRVVGEVDLVTVGHLREQLRHCVPSERQGVVLDCTEVSFLAACGIGLLVEIADQARDAGMALQLVIQSRLVLRALEVTMADQFISPSSTVADALARCLACARHRRQTASQDLDQERRG